jgi:undecaprenyl-diphosphatase
VCALLLFFWRDILGIAKAFLLGIWHRRPFESHDAQIGWLVLVATIPALIAGFLLKDIVENLFKEPVTQAGVRLLMSAGLLGAVEMFGRRERTLESATWLDALAVGLFQVLALFPGASRSGTTISGGMIRGFDRPSAARFAFLMSTPILLAAGMYEMISVIKMPGTLAFLPHLAIGFITAALVGWFAIKWLIDYLSKRSLYVFAVYCAVVGLMVLIVQIIQIV